MAHFVGAGRRLLGVFFGLFDYALQLPFPSGEVFDWLPVSVAHLARSVLS